MPDGDADIGLVVVDTTDPDGKRVRIAALNEQTDKGTEVIGLAFLDEADIAQLEEMERRHETSLFGPQVAQAHYRDQSHYHYFYNCSWVFNQGGSYAISWYMCPNDTWADRLIGDAIGTALGIAKTHPLLQALGGMLVVANEYFFYRGDGSLKGSFSDYRAVCGYVLWNGLPATHWLYYYCAGTANYGSAWSGYYQRFFDIYP